MRGEVEGGGGWRAGSGDGGEGNLRGCVGGSRGGKRVRMDEEGAGGRGGGVGTSAELNGSRASPRGALAGARSQEQGLNVQDTSLVLALMLRKA